MIVPSVSQLIDGSGGDRCGEACLAACLQALGQQVQMLDVVARLGKPVNQATSTIADLLHACTLYHVHSQQLNSQQETFAALQSSAPQKAVIVLLYNALLVPLPYPHTASWLANHFVVLEEQPTSDHVQLMDPLAYPGPNQVTVSFESFVDAVHAVPIIPWGLALWNDTPTKPSIPAGPKGCK